MPYVMVPVPEEHVDKVMQFVVHQVNRGNRREWDADSLGEAWTTLDELGRALLSFVGRATLSGADIADNDLATRMQLNGRETHAIIQEVNEAARERGHEPFVEIRTVAERLPNGRTLDRKVVTMDDDLAQMIRETEETERRAEASGA